MTVANFQNISFDIQKDLVPVTQLYEGALAVLVRIELPIHSIDELVSYAKANPKKLNYGASSIGSTAISAWN